MLTDLERSRVHVALHRALSIPETPSTDTDIRKTGMALAVSRYAGSPELAEVLRAAELIQDFTDGMPATFDVSNVHDATGFDRPACEVLLMLVGARKRGVLTWSAGDHRGEPITLKKDVFDG